MTDSSNTYNSSDFPPEEFQIVPEKPEYTKSECILAIAAALLAFGFVRFTVFNIMGFFTTALYIAIITTVIVYLKHKKHSFSALNKTLAAVLYLFSLVFSITANDFIKALDAIFLFGSGAYFVYSVCSDKSRIDRYLPFVIHKVLFDYPFSRFGTQFRIAHDAVSKSKLGNGLKMVILGLILTIPLTSVVAALLMSADDGLADMLSGILKVFFSDSIWMFILQLLFAIPCSCYLFGMIYANSYRSGLSVPDSDYCEEKLASARNIQNMIVYTAVTPVCILYVLFFISQANYFLSAFAGNLPSGYSYADYARKGFFELLAVTLINLAVIVIMNLHSKHSGRHKPVALKTYTIILSTFTLVLIATAVSKMSMYISFYGLTQLRVYTSWFMLLCAVIFVLIIIKQIRYDFCMARWISVTFTIMFALLCFSRPDALIAKYNIEMYRSGALNELDTDELLDMSDDAVLEVLRSGEVSAEQIMNSSDSGMERESYGRYNLSSIILQSHLAD